MLLSAETFARRKRGAADAASSAAVGASVTSLEGVGTWGGGGGVESVHTVWRSERRSERRSDSRVSGRVRWEVCGIVVRIAYPVMIPPTPHHRGVNIEQASR